MKVRFQADADLRPIIADLKHRELTALLLPRYQWHDVRFGQDVLETLKGAVSSCRSLECPQPRKDLFASADTSLVAGRYL